MGSSSVRPARSPSIGRQERRPNGYSAPSGPRDLTSTESAIGADRSTRAGMPSIRARRLFRQADIRSADLFRKRPTQDM